MRSPSYARRKIRGSLCVYTATRGAALLALCSRAASGEPTSIHAVSAPVRSRTVIAGTSGSLIPFENSMPSRYSRQYARTRVAKYSSVSDGWHAALIANDSSTPRSTLLSATSNVYIVEVRAIVQSYRRRRPAPAWAIIWASQPSETSCDPRTIRHGAPCSGLAGCMRRTGLRSRHGFSTAGGLLRHHRSRRCVQRRRATDHRHHAQGHVPRLAQAQRAQSAHKAAPPARRPRRAARVLRGRRHVPPRRPHRVLLLRPARLLLQRPAQGLVALAHRAIRRGGRAGPQGAQHGC